ncbi:hypothetical protein E8E14_011244 [Neopestalotiopsis sp. 37M]|nr:hypothetical protein E8E14_011244 [Neopestalotiopsis sp. 37M]
MAAVSLEASGRASVTAVLRSNFASVDEHGFNIESVDYGSLKAWKPSKIAKEVPNVVRNNLPPFQYIVVATKNCPDVGPTVEEIIGPAVTPGHTVVVLVQNGLNIEKPLIKAFPQNVVLSGISLIGVAEKGHGNIVHDYHDELIVGAFKNPSVSPDTARAAAVEFVDMYSASGKVTCEHNENVDFVRWRKLIYNSSFNPISTITGMDTTRLRLAKTPVETLVKPAMWEIWSAAKAAGHDIPEEHIENTIHIDPLEVYCKPSMLQDVQKVNTLGCHGGAHSPDRVAIHVVRKRNMAH